jgi:hypothetical protein
MDNKCIKTLSAINCERGKLASSRPLFPNDWDRSGLRYVFSISHLTRLFAQYHFNIEHLLTGVSSSLWQMKVTYCCVEQAFYAKTRLFQSLTHHTEHVDYRNQSCQPTGQKQNTTLAASDVSSNFSRLSQRAGKYVSDDWREDVPD